MDHIDVRRFGFAFALTGVLLYGGCLIAMNLLGRAGTIRFFNSLLHGIDTASIVRLNIPAWEAILVLVQTFLLGWLVGACVAGIYNFTGAGRNQRGRTVE